MTDFLSPGIKVTQIRKGPVVFSGIATAIGGFLVYTPKGPVGKPILVTDASSAQLVFGDRQAGLPGNSRLSDSLRDFFGEGGASCYVVRYIGSGSAVAGRTLSSFGSPTAGFEKSSAVFPVALSDGDTINGKVDGAALATTITVNAKPATKTGTGATYGAVTASHKLILTIGSIPGTQTITFAGTENTETLFLAQINSQLRGASAVDAAGQIKIQTDVRGSLASGSISASSDADVLTSLGLTATAFTAGSNNVGTVDAVTAAEIVTLFGAFTGSTTTNNGDGSVTWTSGTTGVLSSVQFTGGTAVAKIAGFDTSLHSGTSLSPAPAVGMTASSGSDPSPGTWANYYSTKAVQVNSNVTNPVATSAGVTTQLAVASVARLAVGDQISITKGLDTERAVIQAINGTTLTLATSITVPGGGYAGTENVVLETWSLYVYDNNGLQVFPSPFTNLRSSPLAGANYFVNVINGSALTPINVTDLAPAVSDPRPATDANPVLLSGGLDGAAPLATDVISQISAFNQASDINEFSCPGAATDFTGANGVTILKALETAALTRADVMVIQDLPKGTVATGGSGAKTYVQTTANLASSYEAVYWPWIKRLDQNSVLSTFPPSPFIQGIIARTHANKNIGQAPAGTAYGQVQGAVSLEYNIQEQSAEYNDMYPAGVNAILNFPGDGICVFGSRTLDPTGEFGQISVQTVFNINKRIVKQQTRFVNFENNNPATRAQVVRALTSLFREQRKAGILQGTKDSEAFFIICDDSNNGPTVIASGKLVCRIGLAVSRPVEFQDYTFEQDTRAIDAALAAAQ